MNYEVERQLRRRANIGFAPKKMHGTRSDAKEYGAGTSFYEDKNTVHWVENKGTTPAVLTSADIFKP